MRKSCLAVSLLMLTALAASGAAVAQDQTTKRPKLKNLHAGESTAKSVARPHAETSCAEYGAGFARLPGSNTCMRIGGSVSVDAGGRF